MIKSGMSIEGIEVTDTHVGKEVVVTMTNNDRYLPVGFKAKIHYVGSNDYEVLDNEGDVFCIDNNQEFKWATPPKPLPKTTPAQRKKLASAIKVELNVLLAAVKDAEAVGMEVDLTDVREGVKMSFQPPMETW
tara:strand:- start:446 stop:844 length:399 start_codon:yes stop_codon:yes gene_type:complete